MSTAFVFLIQFAILAYALVGGVFLAFSDFIMSALAMTSGHGGVEAMQVINREVFRWVFMALFLGLAVVSLVIAAYGAFALTGTAGTLIMLAGLSRALPFRAWRSERRCFPMRPLATGAANAGKEPRVPNAAVCTNGCFRSVQ